MANGNDHLPQWSGSSQRDDALGGADLDTVLTILADADRREIIRVLARHDRPMSTRELAEQLTERQTVEPRQARIGIALHHRHLPRLQDAGVIERDDDDRVVPTKRCEEAIQILATTRQTFHTRSSI